MSQESGSQEIHMKYLNKLATVNNTLSDDKTTIIKHLHDTIAIHSSISSCIKNIQATITHREKVINVEIATLKTKTLNLKNIPNTPEKNVLVATLKAKTIELKKAVAKSEDEIDNLLESLNKQRDQLIIREEKLYQLIHKNNKLRVMDAIINKL